MSKNGKVLAEAVSVKDALGMIREFASKKDAVCLATLAEFPSNELLDFVNKLGAACNGKTTGNPESYDCPICGKSFTRKWNRTRHMASHEKDATSVCPVKDCKEEFKSVNDLRVHLQAVHGIESDQKKRKLGVRHGDHYDLVSSEGNVLHMSENGELEQRPMHLKFDDKLCEVCPDHVKEEIGIKTEDGAEAAHLLFNDVLECPNMESHFPFETTALKDDDIWHEFFDVFDNPAAVVDTPLQGHDKSKSNSNSNFSISNGNIKKE